MKSKLRTLFLIICVIFTLPFYLLGTFIAFLVYGAYIGFKEGWDDMKNLG